MEYKILWADVNSSDHMSSFRQKLGDVQTFINVESCKEYIESHRENLIYLIVSGGFAKTLVPIVYKYSNIIQIFVYSSSIAAHIEWAIDYLEKLMIFDHGDDLLERLWNDLEAKIREQGPLYTRLADDYKQRAEMYRNKACC